MPEKYSLFVASLLLRFGGISDYTDNFAQQLYFKKRLNRVITPYPGNIKRDYKVSVFKAFPERKRSVFDRWMLTRKIVTLFFYIRTYIWAYNGLRKLKLQNENEWLIFTEYYTFQFDIIIFWTRIFKLKYAIVFHGLDLICEKKHRFTHFAKNIKRTEFIIYNSLATQKLALDLLGIKHEHSMILNPGVNISELENYVDPEKSQKGISDDQDGINFCTISRLTKRKGIDLAIRMVFELAKTGKIVRYYIGGTGEEEKKLKELVQELDAEKYIFFLGDISNEEKYGLLDSSDFFLFPNHSSANSDFEGFGISCIEASFFGNVIIGGSHGGVKEAVIDGETGYLFDFEDQGSLDLALQAIKTCISNPEIMKRIKLRGMEYVRTTYDWNHLIDRFIQSEQQIFTEQTR